MNNGPYHLNNCGFPYIEGPGGPFLIDGNIGIFNPHVLIDSLNAGYNARLSQLSESTLDAIMGGL